MSVRAEAPQGVGGPVVLLALSDIAADHRLWGWSRFVFWRGALKATPGLRFAKLLGSGFEGGFGLRPSASIQALFCVFEDDACADAFVGPGGALQGWQSRCREHAWLKLRAFSSRGSWAGMRLPVTAPAPSQGPVASLTRAAIRPTRAATFWRMEPATERSLQQTAGCLMSVGIGEAPLLRQATFSVWKDQASMDAYARQGSHQAAIRAAAEHGFFSESMFVRFVLTASHGAWRGRTFA